MAQPGGVGFPSESLRQFSRLRPVCRLSPSLCYVFGKLAKFLACLGVVRHLSQLFSRVGVVSSAMSGVTGPVQIEAFEPEFRMNRRQLAVANRLRFRWLLLHAGNSASFEGRCSRAIPVGHGGASWTYKNTCSSILTKELGTWGASDRLPTSNIIVWLSCRPC